MEIWVGLTGGHTDSLLGRTMKSGPVLVICDLYIQARIGCAGHLAVQTEDYAQRIEAFLNDKLMLGSEACLE